MVGGIIGMELWVGRTVFAVNAPYSRLTLDGSRPHSPTPASCIVFLPGVVIKPVLVMNGPLCLISLDE
jgi:hypothetical protein